MKKLTFKISTPDGTQSAIASVTVRDQTYNDMNCAINENFGEEFCGMPAWKLRIHDKICKIAKISKNDAPYLTLIAIN
jgi:hypothetical protein